MFRLQPGPVPLWYLGCGGFLKVSVLSFVFTNITEAFKVHDGRHWIQGPAIRSHKSGCHQLTVRGILPDLASYCLLLRRPCTGEDKDCVLKPADHL
jgi:hypothetical protein